MKIAEFREMIPAISERLARRVPHLRAAVDDGGFTDRLSEGIVARIDRVAAAAERWKRQAGAIEKMRHAIDNGLAQQVESPERLEKWAARQRSQESRYARGSHVAGVQGLGRERKLGSTSDFLSVEFFEAGLEAARSVGRIETPASFGTGFLVGEGLLVTNNHVIDSAEFAFGSNLVLDAEENRIGPPKHTQVFALDPDRFFATSKELDFTFVAVEPESDIGAPLAGYGYHPLIAGEGKIRVGDAVNIIQHPGAGPKNVVVHDSKLIFLSNEIEEPAFCFYTSDTDEGSSGAPVFNTRWEVIALHHASVPKTDARGDLIDRQGKRLSAEEARNAPEKIAWIANEGVRTSRLVAGFAALDLDQEMAALRARVLARWSDPAEGRRRFRESLGRESGSDHRRVSLRDGDATIPINITVSIGD